MRGRVSVCVYVYHQTGWLQWGHQNLSTGKFDYVIRLVTAPSPPYLKLSRQVALGEEVMTLAFATTILHPIISNLYVYGEIDDRKKFSFLSHNAIWNPISKFYHRFPSLDNLDLFARSH